MNIECVSVPVSTVWTTKASPRSIDSLMTREPYQLERYLEKMTYDDRLQLCTNDLAQTQLLFNESVYVVQEVDGWKEILIPSQPTSKNEDGYPGWVPSHHLVVADPNEQLTVRAIIVEQTAWLFTKEKKAWLQVSYGTELTVLDELNDWIKVETPLGHALVKRKNVQFSFKKNNGQSMVAEARRFLGLPYLWAGMSGFGFDCSGFVYRLHHICGITIPRDASNQFRSGDTIAEQEMKEGDLLYFAYEEGKGRVHHVAMYAGNGNIIHAPKTGKVVEEIPLTDTVYEKEWCGVRRFLNSSLWEMKTT
ncbi:C40 family peptidase [Shouchella lehensis]|uniref:Gamma-D-glutamyl-L-lysine endopeptidase n=1 Tax=Shouchella lehensis G1 TaxID=1246626 RepID=A0A060M050_9BACI|nr:C40 family peptidase [Shouchella lehensis]AIC95807.1 Gamma-D-glutamyl-L-lysine endopeptidase [Shouchella lehensis G1]